MAESAGEKTEEATPRKKQQARKKGQVAKSREVGNAASAILMAFGLPALGATLGDQLLNGTRTSLTTLPTEVSGDGVSRVVIGAMGPALLSLLVALGAIMIVGLGVNFVQVGFVMAGEALNPKLERIDPFKGFKRLFSARNAVEGAKAIFKFGVFGYLIATLVVQEWDQLGAIATLDPVAGAAQTGQTIMRMIVRVAIAWAAMAAIDLLFQIKQMAKDLKMTRDELKRDMKEQEGSPEVKMAQHRRRAQLAKGGVKQALQGADVVIANPTHFAVALKYDRSSMHAPEVVAKGVDHLAIRIRGLAREMDVAVIENPPLARALHKKCEVGDFVPRELFGAVAEVLAFVYGATKKAKKRSAA